jgi:hypothetical protein
MPNTKTDWNAADDEVAAETPVETATAPTKPDVSVHKSERAPGLVLPNPQLPLVENVVFAPSAPTMIDDESDKEPLPSNYMKCFPILERLRQIGLAAKTHAEKHAVHLRFKKVSEHCHRLQVGEPPIEANHQTERVERAAHIATAEKNRNERLALLEAALSKDVWTPIIPEKVLSAPLIDFLATDEAQQIIIKLRRALATYEISMLKTPLLWLAPLARKAEHRLALSYGSHPTDEVVQRIVDETGLMASENFALLSNHKRAELRDLFTMNVLPLVKMLLNSALLFITEAKLAAIAHEAEFFETHGNVPWQATPASERFNPVLGELKHRMDTLKNGRPAHYANLGDNSPPPAECELQSVFGVPTLPPAIE